MMEKPIKPQVLKGFRDSLPEVEMAKARLIRTLERTFRLFGFVPIDTPVLEYSEILLGKGGGETEKQVYRFRDQGSRDITMRYDLTVPFARFMAEHSSELYLPFKRYHIGKVWRGENTQRGRYREFIQCDFDIVGVDTASTDFEILLLMARSVQALGVEEFRIRFSHRGVFNRLLARLGLAERSAEILRTVDKLQKVGPDSLRKMLRELAGADETEAIIRFISPAGDFQQTLRNLSDEAGGEEEDTRRLASIKSCIDELGMTDRFVLDPSITRGLDYYTGIVFETYLEKTPHLGSICSGGRYNNLTSLYTKQKMPGVGSSIGLDRLFAAMEELGLIGPPRDCCGVLVLCMDERFTGYYHKLAAQIRAAGITAEVFPEKKKLARQFQHAEKKGLPLALVCGEDERSSGTVGLKDLRTRESFQGLTVRGAIDKIRSLCLPEEGSPDSPA